MNWYRENRWLGNFLLGCAVALLISILFILYAKGSFDDALADFNNAATERSRLEHLNPFPNEENFKKTQTALENYSADLNKLKEELKAKTVPLSPLAPNQFQTRLNQAIANTTEKARGNKVKIPENFHLGFDEFVAALPANDEQAKLLGQELEQIELLLGILIDARVDGITNIKRGATSPATAATPPPAKKTPNAAAAVIERSIVK